MVNPLISYSPAARRPAARPDIVVSSHGTVFVIEAASRDARRLFDELGFSGFAVVPYKTLREVRYAARQAGLVIE